MCGIIYNKSFVGNNVNKSIRKQYFKQKNRGSDGFGFLAITPQDTRLVRSIYEHDIMTLLGKIKSKEILFHHRIPTSTINSTKTNHPIVGISEQYKHNYYMVHNGIITNDTEVKKEHEDMGIRYSTDLGNGLFNDSECLLHDIALYLEGVKKKHDITAKGSVAFILLQTDKMNRPLALYFGRNYGSPLKINQKADSHFGLSSEGDGELLEPNELWRFDYSTKAFSKEDFTFPSYYVSTTPSTPYAGTQWSRDGYCDDDYLRAYDKDVARHAEQYGTKTTYDKGLYDGLVAGSENNPIKLLPRGDKVIERMNWDLFGKVAQQISQDMELDSFSIMGLDDYQLGQLVTMITSKKQFLRKELAKLKEQQASGILIGDTALMEGRLINAEVNQELNMTLITDKLYYNIGGN